MKHFKGEQWKLLVKMSKILKGFYGSYLNNVKLAYVKNYGCTETSQQTNTD